jgi:type IV pilus assembly protein PilM
MALPFSFNSKRKQDQVVAIDLGGRTTKAVLVQRKGDSYVLQRYALMDAPIYERGLSSEMLCEHLKALLQSMEAGTKNITLALGVNDALIRHAELPMIPVGDMRMILKNNPKNYLQQDLPGHLFDCHITTVSANGKAGENGGRAAGGVQKQKVLVGGARKQLVEDVRAAVKDAGLNADQITPGAVGPVNSFEFSLPEVFKSEVVAIVDMGFHNTTICIVADCEMMLSRVVAIGGDKMTNTLSEALNISYAEAEGIKVGMPDEVQSSLDAILLPLGRELRASIDFFEHQHDRTVSQVYLCGGPVQSEFIKQSLQNELMVPCQTWNPLSFMQQNLPAHQQAEAEQISSQLAVAVGAAISTLH